MRHLQVILAFGLGVAIMLVVGIATSFPIPPISTIEEAGRLADGTATIPAVEEPAPVSMRNVVVAARDIEAGEKVTWDMVELSEHPGKNLVALTSPEAIVGRTFRVSVVKGQLLNEDLLTAASPIRSIAIVCHGPNHDQWSVEDQYADGHKEIRPLPPRYCPP